MWRFNDISTPSNSILTKHELGARSDAILRSQYIYVMYEINRLYLLHYFQTDKSSG